MAMMRRGSQALLSLARSTPRSSGGPLLRPGGHRRHLLCLPHEQRLWLPESFRGAPPTAGDQVLLAMNGVRNFVGSEAEMVIDHFGKRPLLRDVPTDRLMVPDPSRPYFIEDDGNHEIRSGLVLIHAMHLCGLSTKGLFTRENVMVLPKTMSFALKEIELGATRTLTMEKKIDEFDHYIEFLVDCIEEVQGPQAAAARPPVFDGLQAVAKDLLKDNTLIEMLIDYPDLLPIDSKGIFYRRVYNILMQWIPWLVKAGLPVPGFVPDPQNSIAWRGSALLLADELLNMVPYGPGYPNNKQWGDIALRNVDVYECMTTIDKMNRNDPKDFVTMLRVGSSHPLEERMSMLIAKVKLLQSPTQGTTSSTPTPSGAALSTDMKNRAPLSSLPIIPPSCTEIHRLFDDSFPEYPSGVAKAFRRYKVYPWLGVRGLFPPRP